MKNKKIIRTLLVMLLVAGFLLGYPTVAYAAGAGDVGSSISNFFTGILDCLVMICEGIIGLFATLIQLLVDIVMLIVGLFT
ncbi:MAG: hypothetical protein IJD63_02620 [Oscillospiraceae bacterium]|nr:hypothetical protein [Oscillospiraceae bacterium]